MIEHLARFPHVRDRSVFIGGFDELPDASFGAGLPRRARLVAASGSPRSRTSCRSTRRRTGGPARLRRRLGYGTGYPLYVAAVGGTAVGRDLLELTAEAFALVRKEQPDARMVMVTGPRIDPGELPDVEGWTSAATCPRCSSTWPAPTSPSCRAGCRPRWNWSRRGGRSSTSRSRTTGSSSTSSRHRLDHYRAGTIDFATTPAPARGSDDRRRRAADLLPAVPAGGAARAARQLAELLVR